VRKREDRAHVGPGAADVELEELTVPAKVDEPGWTPAGLATDRNHLTTEVRLQPLDQVARVGRIGGGREICHGSDTAGVAPASASMKA
jgi:hypothetical protein